MSQTAAVSLLGTTFAEGPRPPPVADAEFRSLMRVFPAAVCVITANTSNGLPAGFTANSVTSVSTEPPSLLICAHRNNFTLSAIRDTGVFAINLLNDTAEDLARRFATRSMDKFASVGFGRTLLGAPVLSRCAAYAECVLAQSMDVSDHVVLIGTVVSSWRSDNAEGLYSHRGLFKSTRQAALST